MGFGHWSIFSGTCQATMSQRITDKFPIEFLGEISMMPERIQMETTPRCYHTTLIIS